MDDGWSDLLAIVVVVTGAFVGAVWAGDRRRMRDWPAKWRAAAWRKARWALLLGLVCSLPAIGAAIASSPEQLGSLGSRLAVALEFGWLFAGIAYLFAYASSVRMYRKHLADLTNAEDGRPRGQDEGVPITSVHQRGPFTRGA
jgi:hypothetical protein